MLRTVPQGVQGLRETLAKGVHMLSPHAAYRWVVLLLGWLCRSGCLVALAWATVSQAQVPSVITSDGTLGTKVTQQGRVHTITGGTRPKGGPNLFHSFDRFDVGTGDTARFTAANPQGIENILSRVTGGQRSHIDGRIQSDIAGANVFLLNPSGVLFGPNASSMCRGRFMSVRQIFCALPMAPCGIPIAVRRPGSRWRHPLPLAFYAPVLPLLPCREVPCTSRRGKRSPSLAGTSRSSAMAFSPRARHSGPRAGRSPW